MREGLGRPYAALFVRPVSLQTASQLTSQCLRQDSKNASLVTSETGMVERYNDLRDGLLAWLRVAMLMVRK